MFRHLISFAFLLLSAQVIAQPTILPAHAHNDYAVNTPLTDALKYHFLSVEADIHKVGQQLYVSHDAPDTKTTGTLEELYLAPLKNIIQENNGKVYTDYNGPFYLMIDVKTDSLATWKLLRATLSSYQEILNTPSSHGPVMVVISGNRAIEAISQDKDGLARLDGRPSDLGKGYSTMQMPIISQGLSSVVSWNGKGNMPKEVLDTIRSLAKKVHAEGKQLRLWATPDYPDAWQALKQAGVDLINTDKLEAFSNYFHEKTSTQMKEK